MSTHDPQQQMIREAMKAIAERRPGKTKLVYDKNKRTIVAVAENAYTPTALNITAEDADMFAVLTLTSKWLEDRWSQLQKEGSVRLRVSSWDNGDAFAPLDIGVQPSAISAEVIIWSKPDAERTSASNLIEVFLAATDLKAGPGIFVAPDGVIYQAAARQDASPVGVDFVDIQPTLDKRRSGILETSILSDATVTLIGLGTGGSHVAVELAKCGVGRFILIDPDRLSVGNVVRHAGGISQVGRLKVNVVRDLILEKNPDAQVAIHPIAIEEENLETIRALIRISNVVICGTDNRPSKLLTNRLCIEEDVVAVYGGAFRRAYGGQVLRVRPKDSACHQCFIAGMPEESADVEISSAEAASAVAYSDRPVQVEPGLSLDVLPIANLLAKLALLELLRGKATTLSVLDRDFDAPWYLWINRPEPGTRYAQWPPLSESTDEMTINRWYGIYFDRDPNCSACGDFLMSTAAALGLDLDSLGDLPSAPKN